MNLLSISKKMKTVHITRVFMFCFITIVVVDALPHSASQVRNKRGFRQSIVDRMGHGFGKRAQYSLMDSYIGGETSPALMTVNEMVESLMQNEELAEAIVKKFLDIDGDGVISTEELLRKPEV